MLKFCIQQNIRLLEYNEYIRFLPWISSSLAFKKWGSRYCKIIISIQVTSFLLKGLLVAQLHSSVCVCVC